MSNKQPIRIWSERFSVCRGQHFVAERIVSDESLIEAWLEVFRKDEPDVLFFAQRTEPKPTNHI